MPINNTSFREIPLRSKKYPGLVALVDEDRYEEVSVLKWNPAKRGNVFYAVTYDGRKAKLMHRFLFGHLGKIIDHRNGNGLDNRKCNVRGATRSQNGSDAGRYTSDDLKQSKKRLLLVNQNL